MSECVHNRLAPGHIFPSPLLSLAPLSPADLCSSQLVTLVLAAGREENAEAQALPMWLGHRARHRGSAAMRPCLSGW